MQFGYFDDAAKEYVITTPHTPYPWINYLGTEEFFGLISHTGGGYTFYKDALMRRLTRYRYNNVPTDTGGRCYYINDGEDVWSPAWSPAQTTLDFFEARHGLSYTTITGERGGIRAEILFVVPLGTNAEVHRIRLSNTAAEEKSFDLFSLAEFNLWNAADDSTNYQRNLSLGEVEIVGSTIYHTTEYRERRNHYAVYAVNAPIDGFDTDRESFFGLGLLRVLQGREFLGRDDGDRRELHLLRGRLKQAAEQQPADQAKVACAGYDVTRVHSLPSSLRR